MYTRCALATFIAEQEANYFGYLIDMFKGMVGYHRACSATEFDSEKCKAMFLQYLRNLASLNRMFRVGLETPKAISIQPFHLRPKCHLLHHLACDDVQVHGSPSSFWCYADESYVGRVKLIAVRTKHPATLGQRVLEKLSLLQALGVDRS